MKKENIHIIISSGIGISILLMMLPLRTNINLGHIALFVFTPIFLVGELLYQLFIET